jgi:hypothetical protein
LIKFHWLLYILVIYVNKYEITSFVHFLEKGNVIPCPTEKHIYILNLFYNLYSLTSMKIGNEPCFSRVCFLSCFVFCFICFSLVGVVVLDQFVLSFSWLFRFHTLFVSVTVFLSRSSKLIWSQLRMNFRTYSNELQLNI